MMPVFIIAEAGVNHNGTLNLALLLAGVIVYRCPKVYAWIKGSEMRTNIIIDDRLVKQALEVSGLKTEREAVERGLRLLIQMKQQERIRKFRGKLHWDGDLDPMRLDS